MLGRLSAGVTLPAAQDEADAVRRAEAEAVPEQYVNREGDIYYVPLEPLHEATVGEVSGTLYVLLGAVGVLLLIACANVANLFLARGTVRAREMALRRALGASGSRVTLLVLTETVLLALVGGVIGVGLAYGGVGFFSHFDPGGIPRLDGIGVDTRVLLFSVILSVATGIVFGSLPAAQATRADMNETIKEGSAAVTEGRSGRRTRAALVVAETAMAVVLLIGAGLMVRTLVSMIQVDPGFAVENLSVVSLSLGSEYDEAERLQFGEDLVRALEAVPGAESAAIAGTVPFLYTGSSRCCWRTRIIGDPMLHDEDRPFRSIIHLVREGYFRALDVPVVFGRDLQASDMHAEASAVVVNRGAAHALFGIDNAVGRVLRISDPYSDEGTALTVVGVVDGYHHWGLSQDVEPAIYAPQGRFGGEYRRMTIAVRSEAGPETVAPALRQAIWRLDPDLPIPAITTMEDRISSSLATPRFLSLVVSAFGLAALLLACAGVYSSMLYTVGQRNQELGIRIALGADGPGLARMIVRTGLGLTVTGIALGTGLALGGTRLLESLVWGVEPTDPVTFVAVALLLAGTAVLASLLPAWRAARTSPIETLRAE